VRVCSWRTQIVSHLSSIVACYPQILRLRVSPLVFIVLLSFFLWLSTSPAPSTVLRFFCRHPNDLALFPPSFRVAICLHSGFPLPSLDSISTTLVWHDIHGRHALLSSNFLDPPRISLFARPSLGA
jgi:hypothetical protein